nr:MAG TPA: hypothetical protein [Caudoviricetes sp.]
MSSWYNYVECNSDTHVKFVNKIILLKNETYTDCTIYEYL